MDKGRKLRCFIVHLGVMLIPVKFNLFLLEALWGIVFRVILTEICQALFSVACTVHVMTSYTYTYLRHPNVVIALVDIICKSGQQA